MRDDHTLNNCPSLHYVIEPYSFLRLKSKCTKVVMKQYVRKDLIYFNSWTHFDLYNDVICTICKYQLGCKISLEICLRNVKQRRRL